MEKKFSEREVFRGIKLKMKVGEEKLELSIFYKRRKL